MSNIFKKIINIAKRWRDNSKDPLHIEFVLTDYCNLNCKGCTHYSPVAPKEFESLASLERDMSHLSAICDGKLHSVYLIGGEPLLYPQLEEAMKLTEKYFPNCLHHLFTNGLKLPLMPPTFWSTARECNFIIALTRYPVKFDYDAVARLCRENGVAVEVFGDRSQSQSFFRFALDPNKKQPKRYRHFACYNRGCISIIDGKMFPCPMSACVNHLNNRFGTNFIHQQGDYLVVSDIKSISQIKRLRDKSVPFCGYCRKPTVTVHAPSKRSVEEWV